MEYDKEYMLECYEYEFGCYANSYLVVRDRIGDWPGGCPTPKEVEERGNHLRELLEEMIEANIQTAKDRHGEEGAS